MKHKKTEKELGKIFTNSDTVQIIRYDLDGVEKTYWITNTEILVKVDPATLFSWAAINTKEKEQKWIRSNGLIYKMQNRDAIIVSNNKDVELNYLGGAWLKNFLWPDRLEEEKLKISSVLLEEEQGREIRICYNDRKVIAVNNKYIKTLNAFFYGREWFGNGEKDPIHCYDSEDDLLGLIMPIDMKNYKMESGKDLSAIATLLNQKGGESND